MEQLLRLAGEHEAPTKSLEMLLFLFEDLQVL